VTNQLYLGDNLDVLRESIARESVYLIYLDPPFNSNANYNNPVQVEDRRRRRRADRASREDEAAGKQGSLL